jgi:hypothetical protein
LKTLSVRSAIPLAALLFALFAAGCGGDPPLPIPTQPSVILQPPAPPPAARPEPIGRPIAVGEIVTAAITSDDASCQYPDPFAGHCQRFVVAAPGDGTLGVRVAWDGASDRLFLAVGSHLTACCGSPLLARVRVAGGSSYTLDVVRPSVMVGGTRSIGFELTTWLDRN